MRTRNVKLQDRAKLRRGDGDLSPAGDEAVIELCRTIDDAAERIADAISGPLHVIVDLLNAIDERLHKR